MFDSTLELVLTAVVFGAIGVFSPTRFAVTAVLLTSETLPWQRALAFTVGSTLVFATAALIGLLGVQVPGRQDASTTINIALGLVMIGVAIGMLVVRRRAESLPDRPPRRPILAAAGLGVGVAIQSFGRLFILLAGGLRIGGLSDSPIAAVAAAALMVGIWQAPIWAPMALFVLRRERFDRLADRARPTLDRVQDSVLGALAVAAVGAWLVFRGLTA